ncbi:MAG: hypothetical protein QGH15_22135 [Kiritimatiellia bacterium]|nr:hypothetical protein [Kiritimatiellia bacterium]
MIWLLASKPREESDDQYVLRIIGLGEEGKADKFKFGMAGPSPSKLLKYYPKALTVSKEGLVEVVPRDTDRVTGQSD